MRRAAVDEGGVVAAETRAAPGPVGAGPAPERHRAVAVPASGLAGDVGVAQRHQRGRARRRVGRPGAARLRTGRDEGGDGQHGGRGDDDGPAAHGHSFVRWYRESTGRRRGGHAARETSASDVVLSLRMPDYGHDLLFGTFLTPVRRPARAGRRPRPAHRAGGARPGHRAGPPVPTPLPRRLDAAHLDRRLDLAGAAGAERGEPAAAAAVGARPQRREPRPALRRTGRARDRRRRVLGRHRGQRRSAPHARRGRGGAGGGDRPASARCGRPPAACALDGAHYPLRGAKAGPAPAHEIGIWVGAYKPRMLRLVGRLADGWLPSAGYAPPDASAR